MEKWLIIVICGIFASSSLAQDAQDSVDSPVSDIANTTDTVRTTIADGGSSSNESTNAGELLAANASAVDQTVNGTFTTGASPTDSDTSKIAVENSNTSASPSSFNYEGNVSLANITSPPELQNISIGADNSDIDILTTTLQPTKKPKLAQKPVKIVVSENGTDVDMPKDSGKGKEFGWEVFEESEKDKTVVAVTEEPDELLKVINASGNWDFSIEGKPVSLVQTMKDTLQYMRNSYYPVRHQLDKRYHMKKQPDLNKTKNLKKSHKAKHCPDEHLIPCNFNVGRDCNLLLLPTGCFVCTCPYKSPARGCLGPALMPPSEVEGLLNGTVKCSSGKKAEVVDRYIRVIDLKGIDDCVPTKQPFCDFLEDVNTYRMPRTKNECFYHCFNDKELDARHIHIENA